MLRTLVATKAKGKLGMERTATPIRQLAAWLAILLVSLCGSHLRVNAAPIHPFHVCVGQLTWNAEEKHWEVSLRVHPMDLERAMKQWKLAEAPADATESQRLALIAGCSVEDETFSKVVVEYLQTQFFLRRAPTAMEKAELVQVLKGGDRKAEDYSSLRWVGKEQEKGWLWLHLEMKQPEIDSKSQRLWLCDKIFIDVVEKQENSVSVTKSKKEKYSLQFKKDEEVQPFR